MSDTSPAHVKTTPSKLRRLLERRAGTKLSRAERRYFEEKEIKEFPEPSFAPLFLPQRAAWVTESGYFRLWRDKHDGKGIDFAQSLEDFSTLNVVGVAAWEKDKKVDLAHIMQAIGDFTRVYETGKREVGTLYETDPGAEWRHTGIAYRRDATGVRAYLNEPNADHLVNPHGVYWWERLIRRAFDRGINLAEALTPDGKPAEFDPAAVFRDPTRTEQLIAAHYQSSVPRHFQKHNPISDEDQKLHPYYYRFGRLLWFGKALLTERLKESVETAEVFEHQAILGKRVVRFVGELSIGALTRISLLPLLAAEAGLLAMGIAKSAFVRMFRESAHEKHLLHNQRTEQLDIIAPFKSILRPVKPTIFAERGTVYLPQATFDAEPPLFLNQALNNAEEEMAIFLGPDSNRTIGSIELLQLGDLGNALPENRRGRRIFRPDDTVIIEMTGHHKFIIGSSRVRDGAYPQSVIASRPSPELYALASKDEVLHIQYSATGKPDMKAISKAAATEILRRVELKGCEHHLSVPTPPPTPEVVHFRQRHPYAPFKPREDLSTAALIWNCTGGFITRRASGLVARRKTAATPIVKPASMSELR